MTRDSALLWIGLAIAVAGFLGEHFGLLQQAFPTIGPAWHARFELFSGLAGMVAAYLRMSPLALSDDHPLTKQAPDSSRTLSITGQVPKVLLALALVGSFTAGCASLPVKQRAVVSLQASETALEAAHDAERLLCSPTADQTKAITHCDGAQAAAIGLTDDVHRRLARLFSIAFDAQEKAALVLKTWRAGDPAPASFADYRRVASEILGLVGEIVPKEQDAVAKAQQAVDEAAKVAAVMGVR